MRKYKLQWYRWHMKRLRKALRQSQFMTKKPTLKSSRRRTKLEQAYQKVGMKLTEVDRSG